MADVQTPESVWVIDVFLTPEELDLIHHLRRPHQDMLTTYSTLGPNPNLTSTIFLHERVQRSQIDKSVRQKKDQKKDPVSFYRTDSGGSADFVTISYGSDSVSYSHRGISPLKRPKPKRPFSVSYEEIKDTSGEVPSSYNTLEPPPLPPKKHEEKCPPLPPKPLPPPVPQRNTTSSPQPPPRTTSRKPSPHSKCDTKDYNFVHPLPSSCTNGAPHGPSNPPNYLPIVTEDKRAWIYGEVTSDETGLSPGVYGTPTSSLGVVISPAEGHPIRHDSDVSEVFGTPPSASPLPDKDGSLSTTTYSDACSHSQSLLTPPVISLADDKSMSNYSSECQFLSEENSNTSDIVPNGQLPSNSMKETEQTVSEKQGINIYRDSLDRSFHTDSEEGAIPIVNGVNRVIKEVQTKNDNELRSQSGISLSELKKMDFTEDGSLNRKRAGSLGSHHQSAGVSQSSLSSGRLSPLRKISQTSNFSETSEGSLVITKAVSEPGSYTSSVVLKLDHPPDLSDDELGSCILSTGSIEPPAESVEPPLESIEPPTDSTEKQDLKTSLTSVVPAKEILIKNDGMMVGQMSFDSVDHEDSFDESDVRNLQDRSPLANENTESTSEDENQMAMFIKRPRAETWIGFQTQSGQPIEKEVRENLYLVPYINKLF